MNIATTVGAGKVGEGVEERDEGRHQNPRQTIITSWCVGSLLLNQQIVNTMQVVSMLLKSFMLWVTKQNSSLSSFHLQLHILILWFDSSFFTSIFQPTCRKFVVCIPLAVPVAWNHVIYNGLALWQDFYQKASKETCQTLFCCLCSVCFRPSFWRSFEECYFAIHQQCTGLWP